MKMDFHGMKRRKLQALCKKHGIPANIKSIEMANRLATLFQVQTSPEEVGKEEERTATESPDECDVHNTSQNEGVSVVVDLRDESNSVASLLIQSCVRDFNGDGLEKNKENCESVTITTNSKRRSVLESSVAENSGGNKAKELREEDSVVFSALEERHEVKKFVQFNEEVGLSTEMHKAAVESPDESDVPNIPGRHPFPEEESELEEAAKSEENKDLELQVDCDNLIGANMSNVVTPSESKSIIGDFEPHTAGNQGEEVEFKDESAFFTRFETCLLLGESTQDRPGNSADFMSKGSQQENVAGLDATQGKSKKSKVNSPHVDSITDIEGADTIIESNPVSDLFVETTPSPSLPTPPILVKETVSTPHDAKNNEESVLKEHGFVAKLAEAVLENSAVHLTLSINNAASSVLDESAVFTTPERNLMMVEQLSQNEKTLASDSVNQHSDEAVESHGVVFTTPEQVLLMSDCGIDEVGKQVDCDNISGANITAESHDMSDVLAASKSQSLMGDFEPYEAENKYMEKKDVELLGESNIFTELEGQSLSGTIGEDSFVFSSPERLLHLEKSEPHTAGNQERELKDESAFFTRFETCLLLGESAHDILGNSNSGSIHHDSSAKVIMKDDSVVRGSLVPALDLGDNTTADSSGSITSKVSYSHEGAAYMSKGSQPENVAGIDATQGTTKQRKRDSPHDDSANLFDVDIDDGADTTMDAEINVSFTSYLLAGTCSLAPEESSPSTNIHNQINDALEELVITAELIETKVTTQRDDKGSLMLDSSCGSRRMTG